MKFLKLYAMNLRNMNTMEIILKFSNGILLKDMREISIMVKYYRVKGIIILQRKY